MEISCVKLEKSVRDLFLAAGVPKEEAGMVSQVYMDATLLGTGHHDVHMIPERIRRIEEGKINPNGDFKLLHRNKAMENYDGDNGLGEVHCCRAARRAVELAQTYGVGVCAVRNSNHNLRNGPYVEYMASQGMLGYMLTKAGPTMGAPGRKEKVCSAVPQGFAAPYGNGEYLTFDACLSYATNSLLQDCVRKGKTIPAYWAVDKEGKPTESPREAMNGGSRQPIGAHKGFGLSLVGEILTGILSEGEIIDEPQEGTGIIGKPAHTAICFDLSGLIGPETYPARVTEMVHRIKNRAEGITIPNEQYTNARKEMLRRQIVCLEEDIVSELNFLLVRYKLSPLEKRRL